MLYTLFELVRLCLHACNYCPHMNGLSRLCEGVPVGPSMGPFSLVYSSPAISKNVLLPCSSGKCHAILSCVGGIAAMVVVKDPQPSNQQESGHFEKWE